MTVRLIPSASAVLLLAALSLAQPLPRARDGSGAQGAVELIDIPANAILAAPLADSADTAVLINVANREEDGRLVRLQGAAATQDVARVLPALGRAGEKGARPALSCLLLPDGRSQLAFPVPSQFNQESGALELIWQPISATEEFGALFCSDTDTAFQAFFAEGSLHFRIAGGQVSCVHQMQPGVRHQYHFLWDRSQGRRAIYIDGLPAADQKEGRWENSAVGKELLFNARANLAFPGRGGAAGFYARIVLYDTAFEPQPAPEPEAPAADK